MAALFLFAGSALLVLLFERARRKRMDIYWSRPCQIAYWQQRFPDVSHTDISDFLTLFVNAFAFRRGRQLCFSPDDKVLAIYRALYPSNGWLRADSLELETLALALQRSYHIDAVPCWHEDITLGDLFTLALHPAT